MTPSIIRFQPFHEKQEVRHSGIRTPSTFTDNAGSCTIRIQTICGRPCHNVLEHQGGSILVSVPSNCLIFHRQHPLKVPANGKKGPNH